MLTSNHFSYEKDLDLKPGKFSVYSEEYLKELRDTYKIDKLAASLDSDFEKVLAITKDVETREYGAWHVATEV